MTSSTWVSKILKIHDRKEISQGMGFDREKFYALYLQELKSTVAALVGSDFQHLNETQNQHLIKLIKFCNGIDLAQEADIESLLIAAYFEMAKLTSGMKGTYAAEEIVKIKNNLDPLITRLKEISLSPSDKLPVKTSSDILPPPTEEDTLFSDDLDKLDSTQVTAINNIIDAIADPVSFMKSKSVGTTSGYSAPEHKNEAEMTDPTDSTIDAKRCRDIIKSYTTKSTWQNWFCCFTTPERYRSPTIRALRDMVGTKVGLISVQFRDLNEEEIKKIAADKKAPLVVEVRGCGDQGQDLEYYIYGCQNSECKIQPLEGEFLKKVGSYFDKVDTYPAVVEAHTADPDFPEQLFEQLEDHGFHKKVTEFASKEIDKAIETESKLGFARYRRLDIFSGKKLIAGEKLGNKTDEILVELRKGLVYNRGSQ